MGNKKVIAVVSDSHGNFDALHHVMEDNPDLSALLFLGDGYHDFEKLEREFPTIPMMGVPGNCDYDCDEPFTKIYHIDGKKLLLTHAYEPKRESALAEAKANLDIPVEWAVPYKTFEV